MSDTRDPYFSGPSGWPDRPLLMGVVNVTPDSFSDGGRFVRWERAVAHAFELVREGADILDVGGESTRPGAEPVSADEEMARVLPVIRALRGEVDTAISVDTRKPEVADAALDAGADWINDVGGLREDAMAPTIARHGGGVIIMHMLGEPQNMQRKPEYDDVVAEVSEMLLAAAQRARNAGIEPHKIWIDPGIGFGKNVSHNLSLLADLDHFDGLGYPVLVGASRKSFIERISGDPTERRLPGSLAAAQAATDRVKRLVLRVHDVAATRQFLVVQRSIQERDPASWPLPADPFTSPLHDPE